MFTGSNRKSAFLTGLIGMLTVISMFSQTLCAESLSGKVLDPQGRIVTAQGNVVNPGLTLPANATGVTINAGGQVSATLPGATTPTTVGQIQLAMFINKAGLQGIGDNLYLETPASGTPQTGNPNSDAFGNLQQGNLEQANVEAVSEISDLIAAQRAYEMNAKVITATDQMLQSTSQMLR